MIAVSGSVPIVSLKRLDPDFLDEKQIGRGELKRPYVLEPPTKQVSLRVPVVDLELARRLARRKGIPKYKPISRRCFTRCWSKKLKTNGNLLKPVKAPTLDTNCIFRSGFNHPPLTRPIILGDI